MADAGGGYGGYEYAYASQAVSPRQIASMTPEERRQLIENYKNSVTPAEKTGLLSSSGDNKVNTDGGKGDTGDPKWSTTNGNIIVSAQRNASKIGKLFKRKNSKSNAGSGNQEESSSTQRQEELDRTLSNSSDKGFQRLPDA